MHYCASHPALRSPGGRRRRDAEEEEEEDLEAIPALPPSCLPQASGRTNTKALQGLGRVERKRARREPGDGGGEKEAEEAADEAKVKRKKAKRTKEPTADASEAPDPAAAPEPLNARKVFAPPFACPSSGVAAVRESLLTHPSARRCASSACTGPLRKAHCR